MFSFATVVWLLQEKKNISVIQYHYSHSVLHLNCTYGMSLICICLLLFSNDCDAFFFNYSCDFSCLSFSFLHV